MASKRIKSVNQSGGITAGEVNVSGKNNSFGSQPKSEKSKLQII